MNEEVISLLPASEVTVTEDTYDPGSLTGMVQQLLDNQIQTSEIFIIFANILFGCLLGFFMVRGMTKAWK